MAERYTIESEIGEGGEGSVFKAYDKVLRRHVALKRVLTKERGSAAEVEKAADALIAEAHTLSALNHPNIITVYDVGKDEEGGFVVMELIKGETLDQLVARGAFLEEDFYRFARQTMEAMMAAQEIKLLHRDLKPSNVMLVWHPGGRFQAKILDFGLAKFSEAPSLQTMGFDDSVKGSIYFMAPEQFERAELDERTDLYAMGCVYYYSLTGKHPFDGETATMVMVSHLQHQVVSLEKVRPDLPAALCQWVMWLMNRDISTRPENAEAALKDFPQNMSEAEQQNIMNLPVKKERSGLTTGVQVVMPTHAVAAPTGMVMTAGNVGEARNQALAPQASAEVSQEAETSSDHSEYEEDDEEEDYAPKSSKLGGLIGVTMLLAAVGYFGWSMLQGDLDAGGEQSKAIKRAKAMGLSAADISQLGRLEELASQENPLGEPNDVDLMVSFMDTVSSTALQKNQAKTLLVEMKGAGVEAEIIKKLKTSKKESEQLWLSQALVKRGAKDLVPLLLPVLEGMKSVPAQLAITDLLRQAAGQESLPLLLDSLKKEKPAKLRRAMEQLAVSILRQLPASEESLKPVLSRLATARGAERPSLWRILGLRGGDVVMKKLEQVFQKEKHDKAYLLDAMEALKQLRTPKIVNFLNTIYSMTTEREIKDAVAEALAHAVVVPSNDRSDVRSFWWQLALKIVKEPKALQQVFVSISDHADAKAVRFLQSLFSSRTFNAYASKALGRVKDYEKQALVLGSGDLLPVTQENVRNEGAVYAEEQKAVSEWVDPEAYFVWHFKMKEAGVYNLEVMQAYAGEGKSGFVCIMGLARLKGRAMKTETWTDYQANSLGAVKLEANRTYALFLQADEVIQPRMMNFKGLRWQKQ
ncbi:MAG: serine/threonine protein kinase [Verrucomicrobiales bacterium]|nr:serine/threonine protein kinase [Verrucomicrobiales bacterium]